MGKLLERNQDIARRCGDLSVLAEPVRKRLWEGNKAVILAGVSPGSTRLVAPLAASTLKRRKGNGPPRAPMGEQSRAIAGHVVSVRAGVGQLSFTGSWPNFPEIEYLDRGTRRKDGSVRMPARPIFGYRGSDLEWVRARLREHVIPTGWRPWGLWS